VSQDTSVCFIYPASVSPASQVVVDTTFDVGGGAVVQYDLGLLPSVPVSASILPLAAKAFPVNAAIV
jgi:hypothetical protein